MEKNARSECDELLFLCTSALRRLENFKKNNKISSKILDETIVAYQKIEQDFDNSSAEKLRELQGITAAILASTDWQSPSYAHSINSKAGSQTGKIDGTINDYKRDRHLDAEQYERAFRASYIDAPLRLPPNVLVTSSGMSAFTTILLSLQLDGMIDGPVVAGVSTYFESKLILESFCREHLTYVDEMDVDALLAAVKKIQPSVIFLDSLCNTETIAMPDLTRIITRLAKEITRPTTLVLDNTGLSIMYQPLKDMPLVPSKLTLIVFESLNKYHQFGLDRVTGGVIWTSAISSCRLLLWRMHFGTIMPDASVLALPEPNRALLENLILRMQRNASYLTAIIDEHLRVQKKSPFSHVVYPGLPTYTGYDWTCSKKFHGSFFVLAPKSHQSKIVLYKKFIRRAIALAKKHRVDLVAGTSFGMDTTRVYLTALHADKDTQPFLRISVGTESIATTKKLAQIFIETIDQI